MQRFWSNYARLFKLCGLLAIASNAIAFGCVNLCGGDWPQLLGPNRDGHVAADENGLSKLPDALQIPWETDCGEGYSGPAIKGDALYLVDRVGDQERLRRFHKVDGGLVWTQTWRATYSGGIDSDRGPRCVPSIAEDRIFVFGGAGKLVCVSASNGAILWSRDLRQEYEAEDGYFGAGSSPLVFEDKVIAAVGGKRSGGVVAVDAKSGATLWESVGAEASYASPILLTLEGSSRPSVLIPTRLNTYQLDVDSGSVQFQTPFGQRGPTVNAATPVRSSTGAIILTASYGIGMTELRATRGALTLGTQRSELLSSQYATPIIYGSTLFGSDGREDYGNGKLRCIDLDAMELRWETDQIGIAHLIGFESTILCVDVTGRLNLLRASSSSFDSLGSLSLPPATYRALPAYSNGILYLKTNGGGQNRLLAVQLHSSN